MTDKQEEKYSMGLSVAKFFETEWSIFGALPQFPPQVLKLKNLLIKIVKESGISTTNTNGYTLAKNDTRTSLEGIAEKVSSALLSYGLNNGNPYIIEEDDYLPSRLTVASDSDIYVLSVLLFRKADPVKASLPTFGSSPADVDLLNTTADSFLEQIRIPFANIKARSRAVAKLKELFIEVNELMKTLDDLLKVYQYNNPTLFSRYRSARNLRNVLGGHKVHKKKGRVLAGFVAYAPFTEKALKGVKQFIFYNESKQKHSKLVFYFSTEPNQHPQPATKRTSIEAGEKSAVALADTGYSVSTPYLNIYNPNARTGHWKAEVKKE